MLLEAGDGAARRCGVSFPNRSRSAAETDVNLIGCRPEGMDEP
jgi:hypothetical protein